MVAADDLAKARLFWLVAFVVDANASIGTAGASRTRSAGTGQEKGVACHAPITVITVPCPGLWSAVLLRQDPHDLDSVELGDRVRIHPSDRGAFVA